MGRGNNHKIIRREIEEVVNDLGKMKAHNEEVNEIDSLLHYLKENKDRMNYKQVKKGGYPIGSGGIESSNTSIVATIYPVDKKDFRLNPYRVFGVNGAEPRY